MRRSGELLPTDVLVTSYPRSGNTWLRLLVADAILQLQGFDTGTTLPVPLDNIIPDLDRGDSLTSDPRIDLPLRVLKTHSPYVPMIRKAIVVFRRPADSLCSYYHYRRHFTSIPIKADKSVDDFCLRFIDAWKRHLRSYLMALEQGEAAIFLTTYEQLHEEPAKVLAGALAFLGLDADALVCHLAAEHHTFANHRQFQTLGDISHEFFRRGCIDSGQQELSQGTVDSINRSAMPLHRRASLYVSVPPLRRVG